MATTYIVNDNSSPVIVAAPKERVAVAVVGERGPKGENGDVLGADKHYEHDQISPAAVWSVTHSLGKHPSVTVVTSSGDEVEGAVHHIDTDSLTITFTAAFAGRAYCN